MLDDLPHHAPKLRLGVSLGLLVVMSVWECLAAQPADELDWLRTEFRLSAPELARVRALHDGYQPECAAMCQRIGEKNRELDALLSGSTSVTAAVEQKLAEVAALRAECQAKMLRHFHAVSATLPPEQGRRYLAEMQRLTLGLGDHAAMPMPAPTPKRPDQPRHVRPAPCLMPNGAKTCRSGCAWSAKSQSEFRNSDFPRLRLPTTLCA